jgi:predicted CDP-diglyceride synthetase/phosphatidate cytidylyltransferase
MWKSVFYKEWLKIRWFIVGYVILGVLGIGYLFMTLKHSFAFTGGKNVWSAVLFQGLQFYSLFKYVPLAGGLTIAITQYLPEAINKRLKLSFHLPLAENKVLMLMQAFGAGCLLISFLVFCGLFAGISLIYFPIQMVADSVITIFPWLLSGFAVYFMVALIILEPNRISRLCYSLCGGLFLTIYYNSAGTAAYAPANSGLFILTAFLSMGFVFSAYRFRKGEM